ncbi:MAG: hypothetical protein PWP23_3002 [Candidatus Sumerlaeota bacterium]|nr:hypothetical protein [Candidatus Sumerlaeota bacterium]
MDNSLITPSCRFFLLLLAFWLCGASASAEEARQIRDGMILDGVPEVSASLQERLLPWQAMRSARFVDWLPADEGILIATRFADTEQFHRVATPMAARDQMTFLSDAVGRGIAGHGAFSHLLLFEVERSGNGLTQIARLDLGTGAIARLTSETAASRHPVWSHASGRFAYATTARNGRDWDIAIRHADDPSSPPVVIQQTGIWRPLDWSPDDARLLVRHTLGASRMELVLIDLASGTQSVVAQSDEATAAYTEALFSETGQGIYAITDLGTDSLQLHYHDLTHNVSKVLVSELTTDAANLALSPDGRLLAFTAAENGLDKLYVLDTETLRRSGLLGPPGIIRNLRFHPSRPLLGLTIERPNQPADAFVWNLTDTTLAQWTESETGPFPPETFVSPEAVAIRVEEKETKGQQRRIPGHAWKPRTPGPFPVLVLLHDGPEMHARPHFDPFLQFLVNELGIAVVAPNLGGSAGHGKAWRALDNGQGRTEVLRDLSAVLDWIQLQPDLDATRVATMGEGYGGYLSLMAQVREGERLRAGISFNGISQLASWLETTAPFWQALERAEFGDERDAATRAFLESISPLPQSERITTPLLLGHGNNNTRVPWKQSEQMVNAIRADGHTAWYLVALDEGEGFSRVGNRELWEAVCAQFLQTYLVSPAASTKETP